MKNTTRREKKKKSPKDFCVDWEEKAARGGNTWAFEEKVYKREFLQKKKKKKPG